ncbi:MAG: hypothetical protein JOZ32_18320 [Bryobacterales bacterium]|nr:hypothetical protein [Bryobacterales bacterium]
MGSFAIICPRDDGPAQQASDWARDIILQLTGSGHHKIADIDDRTPADTVNIFTALSGSSDLACYFGHGDENSWITAKSSTLDASNVRAAKGSPAKGRAIVSIACKLPAT